MVVDEQGKVYPTLWAAAKAYGIKAGGSAVRRLQRRGFCALGGNIFKLADREAPKPVEKPDTLGEQIRARFSEDEIKQLLDGKGLARWHTDYPEIHLEGKHHRLLVMSDTHIGSIYSPEEWHDIVSDYANTNDIEAVLHIGDLVEGVKIGRFGTQIYELSEIGYMKQKAKAVELMSKYRKPVYIISGNHDFFFQDYVGANIVQEVAKELPNMTYIGHDTADIEIGGTIIRLFHGGDGASYALSYRLQKLVEAISGGHKPNILLAGHTHKFCYIFERNIHAISCPCMQMQTSWMRGKKLAAHTGFLELDFDVERGNICNLAVKFFPFYG